MPTEIPERRWQHMANRSGKEESSLGDLLKSLICAFAAGEFAAAVLLYHGYNSEDVIFGASLALTRAFVAAICWFACCIAEALAKSSAQEALTDGLISLVVAFIFVRDGEFLVAQNQIGSILHLLAPLAVSLIVAASLSYYLTKIFSFLFSLRPFKGRKKSGEE